MKLLVTPALCLLFVSIHKSIHVTEDNVSKSFKLSSRLANNFFANLLIIPLIAIKEPHPKASNQDIVCVRKRKNRENCDRESLKRAN